MKGLARTICLTAAISAVAACGREPTEAERLEAERERLLTERQNMLMNMATQAMAREDAFRSNHGRSTPYAAAACRAAIGELMGRNPARMRARTIEANVVEISYNRETDGSRWTFRCEATPSILRWASFENGQQGRWRNEDDISYSVANNVITITVNGDGIAVTRRYQLPSLDRLGT